MNFDYYYNQAGLDSGDITDLWRYDSSASYGAPPFPKTLNISGSQDFSIYFTYKKLDSKRCSLFSNVTNGSGFLFGLTDNNQFFLESINSGIAKDRYLYNIPLAKKNTILLKKSATTFSISDYDPISHRIAYSESHSLSPSYGFGTGKIKVGKENNYQSGFFNSFSGNFDQLAVMSEIYDSRSDLTILKGFRPESAYTSTYYRNQVYSEDEVNWTDGIEISAPDYAYFKDYYYDLDLFLSSFTGEYLGSISGHSYGGYWIASGYFAKAIDSCVASGSSRFYSYTGLLPPTGFHSFYDRVSSDYNLVNQYTNHSLSTNFSGYGSDVSLNHFLQKVWESGYTYSSTLALDSGYFEDFKMNGISCLQKSRSVILAHRSGAAPVEMNTETQKDSIYGGFIIRSENTGVSRVFIDGIDDLSFTTTTKKILPSISGSKCIYDKYSIYNPLYLSLDRSCSGNFYKKSSVVFSGTNSYSQLNRLSVTSDYEELSEYSLYYNKDYSNTVDLETSYNNSADYWQ